MKNSINLVLLFLVIANLSGCASVIYDANQPVRISTVDKSNAAVTDVYCILRNDNGEWNMRTDDSVYVHRSALNLVARCSKNGQPEGLATLISRSNNGVYGNILIGGLVGAWVDKRNGAAFDYPDWIVVVMGDNLIYDRKNQKENEPLFGAKASFEQKQSASQ
ncbi:MAG: hypothetical protein ACAH07_03280 [Methylophilaceae bacterium]|nr:hypothetical protein [Methyloradius sp.]